MDAMAGTAMAPMMRVVAMVGRFCDLTFTLPER
jgi:hypothetical protein